MCPGAGGCRRLVGQSSRWEELTCNDVDISVLVFAVRVVGALCGDLHVRSAALHLLGRDRSMLSQVSS